MKKVSAFNIPMLFLLNAVFGMYGLVWSQFTADIFTVILSFQVYRKHFNDIVNIGLHFFLKNVRPYAASCSEA